MIIISGGLESPCAKLLLFPVTAPVYFIILNPLSLFALIPSGVIVPVSKPNVEALALDVTTPFSNTLKVFSLPAAFHVHPTKL